MKIHSRNFVILVILFMLSPQTVFANNIYDSSSINLSGESNSLMDRKLDLDFFNDHLKVQIDKFKDTNGVDTPFTNNKSIDNISRIRYISHRGTNINAPENTLPAFELAAKSGYKYIETDIQLTSDGHWIIMHDDTVDRMTNGSGKISDKTLSQIKALVVDAGNNIDLYPNLRVPTLEEYLAICKTYNVTAFIELKSITDTTKLDSLLPILEKYSMINQAVISAGNASWLQSVRNRNKNIELALVVNFYSPDLFNTCNDISNCILAIEQTYATKPNIELAHRRGIQVAVWTVIKDDLRNNYISYGADYIITDNLY